MTECDDSGIGDAERIQQLEAENRELAEKLTAARKQIAVDNMTYSDAITELAERVKELEAALREIGNRAGSPTVHYAPQIERIEQRESLDWIAERVRQVLASKKSPA